MQLITVILGLSALVGAIPQVPPPASSPVPPSTLTVPAPLPPSEVPLPIPPSNLPLPIPSSLVPGPPIPTGEDSPQGPICECGYTYCAAVLMAMARPWTPRQLAQAYCSTPNVACPNGTPRTNVTSALYVCLCDGVDQEVGTDLDLIAGCETCLNVSPDFRGRCETPCYHDASAGFGLEIGEE